MYYGFKNERPKRTDVIHDKGQFLNQIMQQAEIFDKGKLELIEIPLFYYTVIILFKSNRKLSFCAK